MSRFPDAEDLRDLSSLVDCLQCIHGLETTVVEQDGRTAVLLILRSDRPALLRSAHDFVTTWADCCDQWCGWISPTEKERRYELGDDGG